MDESAKRRKDAIFTSLFAYMNILRITTVQTFLHWEDKKANLRDLERKLLALQEPTDLIILPEMFTTGFSMQSKYLAESMSGETVHWLAKLAEKKAAVVTGSVIIAEEGQYYNRLIWMRPDGTFTYYDKRHLFALAGEDLHYSAGKTRLVTEWKGWKICPMICYDLRFPVWSRNTEDFDLLIYVANWPEKRSQHWKTLLLARAIENQCFVAGINRVGDDGNGFHHSGDSALIDYSGRLLLQIHEKEALTTLEISKEPMLYYRKQLPFLTDGDTFAMQ